MRFAEDYPTGINYDLGKHVVTEAEIIEFARKYDPQPYHVSVEAGTASSFGGLIASGWNTSAIWMSLYVRTLLEDSAVEGSPGVDELRFLLPVRPGDELYGQAEVIGSVPSLTQRGVVTLKKAGKLTRADGETVLSLVLHSRFRRRPKEN
jgi:acyl dehydratase